MGVLGAGCQPASHLESHPDTWGLHVLLLLLLLLLFLFFLGGREAYECGVKRPDLVVLRAACLKAPLSHAAARAASLSPPDFPLPLPPCCYLLLLLVVVVVAVAVGPSPPPLFPSLSCVCAFLLFFFFILFPAAPFSSPSLSSSFSLCVHRGEGGGEGCLPFLNPQRPPLSQRKFPSPQNPFGMPPHIRAI